MDHSLLERAKRLNAAANAIVNTRQQQNIGMNDQSSVPLSPRKISPVTLLPPLPQDATGTTAPIYGTPSSPSKAATTTDIATNKTFKGAAFRGSSLLTTYTDLRPQLTRGTTFYVDGIPCVHKLDGEFSASRIEMNEDFTGTFNHMS